jgi:hypothetical protein
MGFIDVHINSPAFKLMVVVNVAYLLGGHTLSSASDNLVAKLVHCIKKHKVSQTMHYPNVLTADPMAA